MLLAQPDQIFFPDHRFSACINVHIDAQFFPLTDNIVNLIVAEVQFISIFCCPAAGAVKVAGAGRVQKDCPWNIAAVFLPAFFLFWPSYHRSVNKEIYRRCFHYVRVHVFQNVTDIAIIGVLRICNGIANGMPLLFKLTLGKFIRPVHDLYKIFVRVFIQIVKSLLQSEFFYCC